jgi:hypothetical protein
MASNSKKLGELFGGTNDIATDVLDNVDPSFVSDKNNTSTGYFDLPNGTTAQRPTAASGMIRFNSTLGLAEYYDGNQWKSIDSPPSIDSISPTTESDGSANITITGSNFQSGATVKFIGNDGTEYNSPSVTVNSSTEVVATTPSTPLSVENEPYDVTLINANGLSGTLADALDAGGIPAWDTASGTIFTIYDAGRGSVSTSISATDPDGDTITYALASGDSLPSGLSLNSSTGAITGSTSAVGSDTTTTFDIEASTASGDTVSRTFNIVQKAPVIQSFTSTGSGTFSVPTGVAAIDVLVVGGGGAGGWSDGSWWGGGGGGAGGLIYRPQFPVTPGGSVSYSVGAGGTADSSRLEGIRPGLEGQNSTFGSLTSLGGGGGAADNNRPTAANAIGFGPGTGGPGGNGGGGSGPSPQQYNQNGRNGGRSYQRDQSGDSGSPSYAFGNYGGGGSPSIGGGGGGAAQNGGHGGQSGNAGQGKAYDISGSSTYYAGGGGGGKYPQAGGTPGSGGLGGGGTGSDSGGADNGQANRGGGGGGGGGGNGGSGIVIVKY